MYKLIYFNRTSHFEYCSTLPTAAKAATAAAKDHHQNKNDNNYQ
jgi:hypothetical protein